MLRWSNGKEKINGNDDTERAHPQYVGDFAVFTTQIDFESIVCLLHLNDRNFKMLAYDQPFLKKKLYMQDLYGLWLKVILK